MPIDVSFCCNDPDNGMALHRVDAIEIDACDKLGLRTVVEGPDLAHRFRSGRGRYHDGEATHRVLVGRRLWPVLRYTEWEGNWCWNGASMRAVWVGRLLEYLRRRGWSLDDGPTVVWEAWEQGRPIGRALFDAHHEAAG